MAKANKGEWGEPYAAIRMLGEGKLYIADENGKRNAEEWMQILELIRHETKDRIVTYQCKEVDLVVDVFVNGKSIISLPASEYLYMADKLAKEIKTGRDAHLKYQKV